MKLTSRDIRDFPHVHWFISKELSETRSRDEKVYNAYLQTCSNGAELVGVRKQNVETQAAAALVWAHGPIVLSIDGFASSGTLALTDPETMQIQVRRDLFERYEAAASSGKKQEKQHYFRQLQALLLHECIHWVRFVPFQSQSGRKKVKLFMNVDLPVDTKHGGRSVASPGGKPSTNLTQYQLGYGVITGRTSQARGLSEAGDAFEFAAYGSDLSTFWFKQAKCGSCR